MNDVTIRDYIGSAKELTAKEIRKMPVGTVITVHSFDRWGAHQTCDMTVTAGKDGKKYLFARDYYGGLVRKPISKETDRRCYTEKR